MARSAGKSVALVVLGLVGSAVALFLGVYVVGPRLVLRGFDAFVKRHPAGTSVRSVADDPFVKRATTISVGETSVGTPRADPSRELAAILDAQRGPGRLAIMWTHTPPFGRVSAFIEFDAGRITRVETGDLD